MKKLILLIALLSASALAGGGGPAPIRITLDTQGVSCSPNIGTVLIGVKADDAASKRMAQIFKEDQAPRLAGNIDWDKVAREDAARRLEVLKLLQAGRLTTPTDLVGAAFIFQHGNCTDHYLLANKLSAQAIARGERPGATPHPVARWIYAATYDRWLTTQGKPQKYGTQYTTKTKTMNACDFELMPYDPTTTDTERAKYGVPALAEALAQADKMSAECKAGR